MKLFKSTTKFILNCLLSTLAGVWRATLTIVSGFVTFFFLAISMYYVRTQGIDIPMSVPVTLSKVILFLSNNWEWFWLLFFVIFSIEQYKSLEEKE